jgi:hypothetical protein
MPILAVAQRHATDRQAGATLAAINTKDPSGRCSGGPFRVLGSRCLVTSEAPLVVVTGAVASPRGGPSLASQYVSKLTVLLRAGLPMVGGQDDPPTISGQMPALVERSADGGGFGLGDDEHRRSVGRQAPGGKLRGRYPVLATADIVHVQPDKEISCRVGGLGIVWRRFRRYAR